MAAPRTSARPRQRIPAVPHLRLERALWAEGKRYVVGIDEVGLGSWAGPLTVGAVVVDPTRRVYKVRDSKMLEPGQRQRIAPRIQQTCQAWAVGHATVEEIDRFGLSEARRRACRRALEGLGVEPDFHLVDGNWDFSGAGRGRARTIVKGDAISASIASASIVAKVIRDALMTEMAGDYPDYEWDQNKGYPSPRHKAALRELGPCPLHRRLFAPVAALDHPTLFA
jgi:ribonuclease HII